MYSTLAKKRVLGTGLYLSFSREMQVLAAEYASLMSGPLRLIYIATY